MCRVRVCGGTVEGKAVVKQARSLEWLWMCVGWHVYWLLVGFVCLELVVSCRQ